MAISKGELHREIKETREHDEMVLFCLEPKNLNYFWANIEPINIESEVWLTGSFNKSYGCLDIVIHTKTGKLGIEIKPCIYSFGETLRQINKYKQAFNYPIYLLTKDHRFDDDFNRQDIPVLGFPEHYKDSRFAYDRG